MIFMVIITYMNIFLTNAFLICTAILGACQLTACQLDNLQLMLSELYLPFSVVGLTEIKLKAGRLFTHFSIQSFKCWRIWFLY